MTNTAVTAGSATGTPFGPSRPFAIDGAGLDLARSGFIGSSITALGNSLFAVFALDEVLWYWSTTFFKQLFEIVFLG